MFTGIIGTLLRIMLQLQHMEADYQTSFFFQCWLVLLCSKHHWKIHNQTCMGHSIHKIEFSIKVVVGYYLKKKKGCEDVSFGASGLLYPCCVWVVHILLVRKSEVLSQLSIDFLLPLRTDFSLVYLSFIFDCKCTKILLYISKKRLSFSGASERIQNSFGFSYVWILYCSWVASKK